MIRLTLSALTLSLALAACVPLVPSSRQWSDPMFLQPVTTAALAGTWYEVARYPTPFEAGCSHATATYTPQPDGTLAVLNRCRRGGAVEQIRGVATPDGPGQLTVRLEGVPFGGELWVLGLTRDGRTLYLGTPARTAGWVLHRDRRFTYEERHRAARLFRTNGYDEAALQRTDQR